jgi:hypothetical protein
MMNKKYVMTIIVIYAILSTALLLISGAPIRVNLVDIASFFIAFVVPGMLAFHLNRMNQVIMVWLVGGGIGLFMWDVVSTLVIVKRELFMGWYILYPIGLTGLVLLQIVVKYISDKAPYNAILERKRV